MNLTVFATLAVALPVITTHEVAPLSIVITGFLCLLNIALAIFFRKNGFWEILFYYVVSVIELSLCILSLLFMLDVIKRSFFTLPSDLPFNQIMVAVALAIGIGLFPAAYWHRVNVSELPKRIAEDGKTLKESNVRVRNSLPGEWMN